ncbi:MAG: helix-turn-helix domain containing protein, partial [Candidatus Bipolaricaulis sp.]|nr:helix-turn-helix domain containing protein [Candidatus Bipolaricaulis sp.]
VVDYLMEKKEPTPNLAQEIVANALKNMLRDTPAIVVDNVDGYQITQTKPNRGYPRCNVLGIENETKRQICVLYWQQGMTEDGISEALGVTQQYVSKTIKQYAI